LVEIKNKRGINVMLMSSFFVGRREEYVFMIFLIYDTKVCRMPTDKNTCVMKRDKYVMECTYYVMKDLGGKNCKKSKEIKGYRETLSFNRYIL